MNSNEDTKVIYPQCVEIALKNANIIQKGTASEIQMLFWFKLGLEFIIIKQDAHIQWRAENMLATDWTKTCGKIIWEFTKFVPSMIS